MLPGCSLQLVEQKYNRLWTQFSFPFHSPTSLSAWVMTRFWCFFEAAGALEKSNIDRDNLNLCNWAELTEVLCMTCRKKNNTENQEKRDEKTGKGELMCHSLFREETSMQPVTWGKPKLCIYVSPGGLSRWWICWLMLLMKPEAIKEFEEIRGITKSVTEVMCN